MFAETFIGTVWNVTLFSLYPSKATSGNNFEEGKDFGLKFLNVAFIEKLGLLEASNNIDWGKTLKSWGIFQRGDFISSRPQIPEGKKGEVKSSIVKGRLEEPVYTSSPQL